MLNRHSAFIMDAPRHRNSRYIEVFLFLFYILSFVTSFDPFLDDISFSIVWSGSPTNIQEQFSDANSVEVMTSHQEKYRCSIPAISVKSDKDDTSSYTGLDEMNLLAPLFFQTACSYRIETYWTYELCHGQHLRQYHEEKESSKKLASIQEYFLGRTDIRDSMMDEEEEMTLRLTPVIPQDRHSLNKVPVIRVDNVDLPYFPVTFTDGTVCDLTGKPRQVALQYVCKLDGTGEIFEIKETTTCEYEVVVFTQALCQHPKYRLKTEEVQKIRCYSLDGAPHTPLSLHHQDPEDLARYTVKNVQSKQKPVPVKYKAAAPRREAPAVSTTISAQTDRQVLRAFVHGEQCVTGGTGWWKHELCYGHTVTQFHDDATGRTSIKLGIWNMEKHKQWLNDSPEKRPRPVEKRKYVSHFYGGGDFCDLTGHPRVTEVKLKCVPSPSQPHAISIYIVEPTVCTYLLVVESQLFCDVIKEADDDGIFRLL